MLTGENPFPLVGFNETFLSFWSFSAERGEFFCFVHLVPSTPKPKSPGSDGKLFTLAITEYLGPLSLLADRIRGEFGPETLTSSRSHRDFRGNSMRLSIFLFSRSRPQPGCPMIHVFSIVWRGKIFN
jgi:hypothetical protein